MFSLLGLYSRDYLDAEDFKPFLESDKVFERDFALSVFELALDKCVRNQDVVDVLKMLFMRLVEAKVAWFVDALILFYRLSSRSKLLTETTIVFEEWLKDSAGFEEAHLELIMTQIYTLSDWTYFLHKYYGLEILSSYPSVTGKIYPVVLQSFAILPDDVLDCKLFHKVLRAVIDALNNQGGLESLLAWSERAAQENNLLWPFALYFAVEFKVKKNLFEDVAIRILEASDSPCFTLYAASRYLSFGKGNLKPLWRCIQQIAAKNTDLSQNAPASILNALDALLSGYFECMPPDNPEGVMALLNDPEHPMPLSVFCHQHTINALFLPKVNFEASFAAFMASPNLQFFWQSSNAIVESVQRFLLNEVCQLAVNDKKALFFDALENIVLRPACNVEVVLTICHVFKLQGEHERLMRLYQSNQLDIEHFQVNDLARFVSLIHHSPLTDITNKEQLEAICTFLESWAFFINDPAKDCQTEFRRRHFHSSPHVWYSLLEQILCLLQDVHFEKELYERVYEAVARNAKWWAFLFSVLGKHYGRRSRFLEKIFDVILCHCACPLYEDLYVWLTLPIRDLRFELGLALLSSPEIQKHAPFNYSLIKWAFADAVSQLKLKHWDILTSNVETAHIEGILTFVVGADYLEQIVRNMSSGGVSFVLGILRYVSYEENILVVYNLLFRKIDTLSDREQLLKQLKDVFTCSVLQRLSVEDLLGVAAQPNLPPVLRIAIVEACLFTEREDIKAQALNFARLFVPYLEMLQLSKVEVFNLGVSVALWLLRVGTPNDVASWYAFFQHKMRTDNSLLSIRIILAVFDAVLGGAERVPIYLCEGQGEWFSFSLGIAGFILARNPHAPCDPPRLAKVMKVLLENSEKFHSPLKRLIWELNKDVLWQLAERIGDLKDQHSLFYDPVFPQAIQTKALQASRKHAEIGP